MWDFIKQHFDKLLLAFFILYFSALGWHAIFYLSRHTVSEVTNPVIKSFMDAMLDNQKLVIGALLGLITGRALSSVKNGGTNVSLPTANTNSTSTSTTPTV